MSEQPSSELPPLLQKKSVPARLKYFKENFPDAESFVFFTPKSRQAITYSSLYLLASRFARRLHDQGFKRPDVIANTLPNSPERVITELGIVFSGCTPLNGEILLKSGDDFLHAARSSKCRAVVVIGSEHDHAWRLLRGSITAETNGLFIPLSCDQAQDLTTAIVVKREESMAGCSLMNELNSEDVAGYVAEVGPDDTLNVFTTSGSTGYYKMVPHSNRFFFEMPTPWTLDSSSDAVSNNIIQNKAIFNDRPMGWIVGYPYFAKIYGKKRLLPDEFYEFKSPGVKLALTWKILKQEKWHSSYMSPRDIVELSHHVGDIKPEERIAVICTFGQPMMKSAILDMMKISKSIVVVYGSTEIGNVSYKHITDKNKDKYKDFCVGKPCIEHVRIVNTDKQECQPWQVGTIWVKDDGDFSGYLNPLTLESRPANVFLGDGWINMGDSGYLDEEGELYVMGRQGNVITHGVEKVYPGLMERKLATHADIGEVVLVPVSDPVKFQNICACVRPAHGCLMTESVLKQIVHSMLIEEDSIPKFFLILDELPQTKNGKIDRKLIGKMAEEKFGKS